MTSEITPPDFDPSAIERIRKVAGDQASAFVAEMIQLFFDETARQMGDIKRGCAEGDWKLVNRTAHSMKSSAATLGLMQFAETCRALENSTRGGVASAETRTLAAQAESRHGAALEVLKTVS